MRDGGGVRLTAVRQFVMSPAMLAFGLAVALVGAGLPTGIMAYEALANGESYTVESWALIAPAWGLPGLLWLLVRRWPMAAAVLMGWLAIPAGLYYSDVYAQYPAAILFLLAAAVVLLPDSTAEDATPSAAVPQD